MKCLAEPSHKWHILVCSLNDYKSLLWLIDVVLVVNRSHFLCRYHLLMVMFHCLRWKGLLLLHELTTKYQTVATHEV